MDLLFNSNNLIFFLNNFNKIKFITQEGNSLNIKINNLIKEKSFITNYIF